VIIRSVNTGDAILSVQAFQLSEATELRWDGVSEVILVEAPVRESDNEAMRTMEDA